MAYAHTPATFIAACKAAIADDLGQINNTTDRETIRKLMNAFITAVSDEFEVVDQT